MEEHKMTFDEELEWCVNQLLIGLLKQPVNAEQIKESQRVIRQFTHKTKPYVAKRHLMRVVFGTNYKRMMQDTPLESTRRALATPAGEALKAELGLVS
jgi:hypothetical protein